MDRNRGEDGHRWPMFLPDGTHFLYMAANFTGRKGVNAIFVGSLNSNEKRFVVEATANAAYAAPGYLLFYRDRTLLAQSFDRKSFSLTGEPTTILTGLQYLPQVRRALFAVSDNGALVAQTGRAVALSQRPESQKFSIIQTLLLLVIPWIASSRPFGAAIAHVRHAPR